jgi:thymidine kinase
MKDYMFEIITGPMGCGKTEELLRRIKRAVIANKSVKIFFPAIDNRISGDYIKSRNGIAREAIRVHSSKEIMAFIKSSDDIVAIDELQFFDKQIVDVGKALVKQGKKVIAGGWILILKKNRSDICRVACYANKVDK